MTENLDSQTGTYMLMKDGEILLRGPFIDYGVSRIFQNALVITKYSFIVPISEGSEASSMGVSWRWLDANVRCVVEYGTNLSTGRCKCVSIGGIFAGRECGNPTYNGNICCSTHKRLEQNHKSEPAPGDYRKEKGGRYLFIGDIPRLHNGVPVKEVMIDFVSKPFFETCLSFSISNILIPSSVNQESRRFDINNKLGEWDASFYVPFATSEVAQGELFRTFSGAPNDCVGWLLTHADYKPEEIEFLFVDNLRKDDSIPGLVMLNGHNCNYYKLFDGFDGKLYVAYAPDDIEKNLVVGIALLSKIPSE